MTSTDSSTAAARRLVTLTPKDPRFLRYLDGSFSKTHRALALESLNINTLGEEITFAVVEKSKLEKVGFLRLAFLLVNPSNWIFTAAPLALTVAFLLRYSGQFYDQTFVAVELTTIVGVSFLHLAVQWLSQYGDHMSGRDRVPSLHQLRVNPIQSGFVTAGFVRRLAFFALGLAFAFGVPVVMIQGWRVGLMALLSLALGLAFAGVGFGNRRGGRLGIESDVDAGAGVSTRFGSSSASAIVENRQRLAFKSSGLGEIIVFLMSGPLLAGMLTWAVDGEWNWQATAFVCLAGAVNLLVYHMHQMVRMMADSQVGVRSWAVRLGFDRAKRFAIAILFLVPVMLFFLCWMTGDFILFLASVVAMSMPTLSAFRHIQKIESPLSSSLHESSYVVRRWAWIWVIVLCALLVI